MVLVVDRAVRALLATEAAALEGRGISALGGTGLRDSPGSAVPCVVVASAARWRRRLYLVVVEAIYIFIEWFAGFILRKVERNRGDRREGGSS